MKCFKILQFSIDFSTTFLIFSLASGSSPQPPTNPYFQNFLKFPLNFRENFDKILKKFQKIAKFTCKFAKNYKIFIDFLTFLESFRVWKNAKIFISPMKKVPPCFWDPPKRKILYKTLLSNLRDASGHSFHLIICIRVGSKTRLPKQPLCAVDSK